MQTMRERGNSLEPVPPARTIPFMGLGTRADSRRRRRVGVAGDELGSGKVREIVAAGKAFDAAPVRLLESSPGNR